jgi:hypothetical protein
MNKQQLLNWRSYLINPLFGLNFHTYLCVGVAFSFSEIYKIYFRSILNWLLTLFDLNQIYNIRFLYILFGFCLLMQSWYQEFAKLKAKYESLQSTQRLCYSEYIHTYMYMREKFPQISILVWLLIFIFLV